MTMKREIEFRGQRADNKEWVYGFYYKRTYFYGDLSVKHYIIVSNEDLGYDQALEYYEVIPETVGQYVGIKDKNGKKVYEGDIVYCSYNNCEVVFGLYGVCDYKTVGFFMKVNEALFTDEEDNFVYWGFEDGDKIEVLGNVYENPELLDKIEYKGESDNGD